MNLNFATMEDVGARTGPQAFGRLCQDMGASLDPDNMLTTPDEIRSFDADLLATIDGFFIDFELNVEKVPNRHRWEVLALPRHELRVPPQTGMSTLLWLRDVMEGEEYRVARKRYLATKDDHHRRWVGGSLGKTRLFAFVEFGDLTSQLFLAAAYSWFGACHFNAQTDFRDSEQRHAAIKQLQYDHETYVSKNAVTRWAAERGNQAFDAMCFEYELDKQARDKVLNLIPTTSPLPINFDLFRIYLEHNGKTGFGSYDDPLGFRDAFHSVTGVALPKGARLKEDPPRLFNHLHTLVDHFRTSADPNASAWSDWTGTGAADPLSVYLTETALFWEAEDVRIAFHEHLRKIGRMKE